MEGRSGLQYIGSIEKWLHLVGAQDFEESVCEAREGEFHSMGLLWTNLAHCQMRNCWMQSAEDHWQKEQQVVMDYIEVDFCRGW
jgi:hypothetical protein